MLLLWLLFTKEAFCHLCTEIGMLELSQNYSVLRQLSLICMSYPSSLGAYHVYYSKRCTILHHNGKRSYTGNEWSWEYATYRVTDQGKITFELQNLENSILMTQPQGQTCFKVGAQAILLVTLHFSTSSLLILQRLYNSPSHLSNPLCTRQPALCVSLLCEIYCLVWLCSIPWLLDYQCDLVQEKPSY